MCFHVEYSYATEYNFVIPPEALILLGSLSGSWTTWKMFNGVLTKKKETHSLINLQIKVYKGFHVLLWSKKIFHHKDIILCWQEIMSEFKMKIIKWEKPPAFRDLFFKHIAISHHQILWKLCRNFCVWYKSRRQCRWLATEACCIPDLG